MILYNGFEIFRVFYTIQLIVFHHELDYSLISSDTIYNWLEVALELIAWKINLAEIVVLADQCFADNVCGLVTHTLVLEAEAILSLSQSHLCDKSFSLLVRLARKTQVHTLCFIKFTPNVGWNCRLILSNERFNNRILFTHASPSWLLIGIWLLLDLNNMLVEDRPISLDFMNILILLLTLSRNINAITFFHL